MRERPNRTVSKRVNTCSATRQWSVVVACDLGFGDLVSDGVSRVWSPWAAVFGMDFGMRNRTVSRADVRDSTRSDGSLAHDPPANPLAWNGSARPGNRSTGWLGHTRSMPARLRGDVESTQVRLVLGSEAAEAESNPDLPLREGHKLSRPMRAEVVTLNYTLVVVACYDEWWLSGGRVRN
jgi:hypothetical protein